jgi:uncharacterized protein (TIGR03083 family)
MGQDVPMPDAGPRLLLTERDNLLPLLRRTPEDAFDRPTVCTGWSVRDVIAHCAAALVRASTGDLHRFTPEDNQGDVDARKQWPVGQVLDELARGYAMAAGTDVGSALALGEWVHGGDVREALGLPDAYASAGIQDALAVLAEVSILRALPATEVELTDAAGRSLPAGRLRLGDPDAEVRGRLRTDTVGLVRLAANRRPETVVAELRGVPAEALRVF